MPQFKRRALDLINTIKSGDPVLNRDRSVPAEDLWPATLEKEADKAASILRSFFIDGFIVPYRTLGTCPRDTLRNLCGLAVFHVLRAGLHSPSCSGSGVVVSRLNGGGWSPASAITVDLELPQDVEVADIVVMFKGQSDLDGLLNPDAKSGKEHVIEPGPIPRSDALAAQLRSSFRDKGPLLFHAKSKGQLVELNFRHLAIREVNAENERFYGVSGIAMREILSGQAKTPSGTSGDLYSTLNAIDQANPSLSGLPKPGKCPGDCRVRAPTIVS